MSMIVMIVWNIAKVIIAICLLITIAIGFEKWVRANTVNKKGG